MVIIQVKQQLIQAPLKCEINITADAYVINLIFIPQYSQQHVFQPKMLCRQQASNIANVEGILRIENQIPILVCANNDTITHWSLRHCRQTKIIKNIVQGKIQLFQYYKSVYFIVSNQILTIFTAQDYVQIQLRFRAIKLFLHQINESVKVIQTVLNKENQQDYSYSYSENYSELNQDLESNSTESYSESDVEVFINDYMEEKIVLLIGGINGQLLQYHIEILEGEIYVVEVPLMQILYSQFSQEEKFKTVWTEYEATYLLACSYNSLFLLDKATGNVITALSLSIENNQFVIKQLKNKITNPTDQIFTQFINQNMNYQYEIQHAEYSDGVIFLTIMHEKETYLIACNIKKGQILTQLALNNYVNQEIKQLLATGSEVYMFYDSQYIIIDLHSRQVTNKITYDKITQKSIFQSAILMNKSPYTVLCIIHSHRFAIYEKNIVIQHRKTVNTPQYVSFINDLISKHFRDDTEAIILSKNSVNLLKFNNQTIHRQIEVINAKNLQSSGRYIFMIQQNENGHEYVQMYELLKHKVQNVSYYPIQGQQALSNLCTDLKRRCSKEEFEYHLLNDQQYKRNINNYQNNLQPDQIRDYCIDSSTQNIGILSQHGVSVFSVEAGYFNCQYDTNETQYDSITYIFSSRDTLIWQQDDPYTQVYGIKYQDEQVESSNKLDYQYIGIINKQLQLSILCVTYNSARLVYEMQIDNNLLHINENTQNLLVQYVQFINRENVFYLIAFDPLNSENQFLYFFSINFNGYKVILKLLRHTTLKSIFINNNKVLKRDNNIYFSHEHNIYSLDLRTNVLRRSQKLVAQIKDFDVSSSGEECIVCFNNSDTTNLYSLHLCGFEVVTESDQTPQIVSQSEKTLGDKLIRYILTGSNKQNYRKDAARLKRGNALAQRLGVDLTQQDFITEQDILFIGIEEDLLQLLQKVKEMNDDKYTLGVLYMACKYQFQMIFSNQELKKLCLEMYKQIEQKFIHQKDTLSILSAFITFVQH